MTVKELQTELNDMPDDAVVIVTDASLVGHRVDKIEIAESPVNEYSVVRICLG